MAQEEIITGLDVGSNMVRVVVGQKHENDSKVHILGIAESPSEGISKGIINSIEDAVSSISSCLEKAERMTGMPIEHSYVSISGSHIVSQDSHGIVAVSKADGEIRDDDVERAIEAAQTVATPPNYEILHVIPRSFTVDNQKGIKDPTGMTGIRLEVDAEIILGQSSQIKNLTKCIYRTSVDIDDLVLGVLASAESILTKRQKDLGVAVLNIGSATASLLVMEEGDVIHTAILPIGSGHITNDIAIGLRTSIDVAEKVKLEYGSSLPNEINKRDEIDLSEVSPQESERVSHKHVAEIIEARLEEIFDMVEKELKKIGRSGLLPAGIVLTGGGAKLPGIVETAKAIFKLPCHIGYPLEVVTAIDKINDPTFTTAIGLVLWGSELSAKPSRIFKGGRSSVKEVTGKMNKWFKSLMP
ncbi:cell division protein FtsA [Patescibacteria group bacterium]|nr:cell division protein FtsA [Patescibacteria group bacterium]MBU2235503.1 cell division protein FtsA [Patescibacteria group bacterium]